MRGRKARPTFTAPKETIAYCRVSTEDQAREGVSLDAQKARIRAYCEAMDITLTDIVSDAGESAKTLKRPGVQRVLERVRAGEVARVVVLKLDRLTRSVKDLTGILEAFNKHSAALVSVSEHLDTQSAGGRLVVNMLGVVAQWEREAIAERTSLALSHKRANRQVYGRTPFGYRREGKNLVPHAPQLRALAEARLMNDRGHSLREIAERLTAMNVLPQGGGQWYPASVRAILNSKMTLAAIEKLHTGE